MTLYWSEFTARICNSQLRNVMWKIGFFFFLHSIVLIKSQILHAQCNVGLTRWKIKRFLWDYFRKYNLTAALLTQCFDVIEVVKTRHIHIVTIADFPKNHYLSLLACWLRTCQRYPTTILSACDLWKMKLLYSTNIFPLVYESSFQSVLSHFEDSGSFCLLQLGTLPSKQLSWAGHSQGPHCTLVILSTVFQSNYDSVLIGILFAGICKTDLEKCNAIYCFFIRLYSETKFYMHHKCNVGLTSWEIELFHWDYFRKYNFTAALHNVLTSLKL